MTGKPPGFAATSFWFVNLTPCLLSVESLLISSDLIASQLLLGNCSLHPTVTAVCVIPSHLNSSHLMSSQFFLPHLISSHVMSSLPSQLFSADHNCSHLFSCHPELFSPLLISSQLIPAFLRFSQFFSTLLSSPQLMSALLMSSHLFSHLLSSSHISLAGLSSCQLVSPHLSSSQRTLKSSQLFSSPKPAPKTDLGAKASNP